MYIYFSSMNDHLIDSLRMFAPVTILITPNLRMVHLQLSVWVTLPPVGGLTSDEQTFTSSTRKHRRQLQRSCCPHIPYPATLVRLKDKKTLYRSISGFSKTVTTLILAAAGLSVFAVFTLMWINLFKSKYYTSLINKIQTIERSDITNKV